jgi:serine protease
MKNLFFQCKKVNLLIHLLAPAFLSAFWIANSYGETIQPGIIVVKFKESVKINIELKQTNVVSLNQKIEAHGINKIRQPYDYLNNSKCKKAEEIARLYYFHFEDTQDPVRIAADFNQDNQIEYAEPLYLHFPEEIPNDPQWGQDGDLVHVKAPQAWDIAKGDSGSVIIGIVDNGTEWDHPELVDNLWQNLGEDLDGDGFTIEFIGGSWVFDPDDVNGIDDDNNNHIDDFIGWDFISDSNDPTATADHGTLVAGTAAGGTNNGIGGASISWNCTFLPVASLGGNTDTYQGIVYAVSKGADIINCSWGRLGSFSAHEQDIIDFAYDNGTLVVASAGNGGDDDIGDNNDDTPHYPSNYRHVLGVGSTNQTNDIKAEFSNYGRISVDVFAPGVHIYVPVPGGVFGWADGTSLSSPMVAGLAGLVKTKFPNMTPDEIEDRILLTAQNIDSLNPDFAGYLGYGRIDAFQAVDPDFPVLKVVGIDINDSGENGVINPEEIIDIGVWIKSFYTNISAATIELKEYDNYITLTAPTANISNLNMHDSTLVHFQFNVANNVPDGHQIDFTLKMIADGYLIRDYFSLSAYGDFLTHNTGTIQTSITTQGNIGYTGFGNGQSAGDGFQFLNHDYLYEAGIMIGTGIATISDCIRGTNPQVQDNDFRSSRGEILTILSPAVRSYEKGSILLVDSIAQAPIGISVFQESYADTATNHKNFIILKYTITNLKSVTISNLRAGMFVDWNVNTGGLDFATYDTTYHMGVVKNLPTGGNRLLATKLLTQNGGISYRTINNGTELNDGFSIMEKWNFLTGGIQTTQLLGVNVSTLISEGPFTLAASEQMVVAFALIAAESQAALETSAQETELFWNDLVTGFTLDDIQETANTFKLFQNYPNPFNPTTKISWQLAVKSKVEVKIYSLLGQKIRTLLAESQEAGHHSALWDGRDNSGSPVASGVYIYRLSVRSLSGKAENFVSTRKMILLK